MKRLLILSVAPMMVLFFVSLAFAPTDPIPHLINYQGMLTDPGTGDPLDGSFDLTFSFYDVSTGGSPLWDETHPAQLVEDGLFSVIIGSETTGGIPSSVFDDPERYLGIKVGTGDELTPRIRLTSVGYAYLAETAVTDGDWTLSGDDMYSAVIGKVGIGAAPPAERLDVAGTVKMTGFKMPLGASDGRVLTSDGSGVGTWKALPAGGIGGIGTTNYIPKFTAATTVGNSEIYQSGSNVGIGTTSPDAVLDVYGTRNIGATSDGIVNIGSSSGYHVTLDRNEIHGRNGSSTSDLYINDFGGDVLIARQSNVGIGTTSPGSKLQVYYNSTHYVGTNVSSTQAYTTYRNDTHTWKAGLDGYSGNWYMITANGTDYLQLNQAGTMNIYSDPVYLRTTYNNSISSGRDLYISSIGELGYLSSSIRYKKNIRSLDGYSSKICELKPVAFDFKEDEEAVNQFGLIAEEVEKVLPEIVSYDEEQRPETVLYSKLVPLLLNELIQVRKQNETLEDRIRQLESEVSTLSLK